MYNQYKLSSQAIVTNIWYPIHCFTTAKAGTHIVVISYNVFLQMVSHLLTDIGISHFLIDWEAFLSDG